MPPLCMHSFLPCDSVLCASRPRVLVRCVWRRLTWAASCRDATRLCFAFPSRSSATKEGNQFRRRVAPSLLFLSRTRCLLSRRVLSLVAHLLSPVQAPLVTPHCIYRQSCRVEGVLKLCLRLFISLSFSAPARCLSERSLCRAYSLHRRLVARCCHSPLDFAVHVLR